MRKKIGLFLGVTPSMGGVFHYSRGLLEAFLDLSVDDYEKVIACAGSEWDERLKDAGCADAEDSLSRLDVCVRRVSDLVGISCWTVAQDEQGDRSGGESSGGRRAVKPGCFPLTVLCLTRCRYRRLASYMI